MGSVERPAGATLTHLPALDGLRGLAVIGVLALHGGFASFRGGFLGVSIFFTLSGFLITSLLLREHQANGTISLRAFWTRRFRRLMPAALLGLLVACAYGAWFASPEQLATLRADALAALGYVANWRFVLAHKRYADLFAAPSPVQHFWSLAIEEQFYVVYPVLVYGCLRLGGRRLLTVVLALLAAGSVLSSFAHAGDIDRVYYGTDTRAFELLAGALFALWWSAPRRYAPGRLPRPARELLGWGALAGSLVAWRVVEQTSTHLPKGGFTLQAAASVAMLVAITSPTAVGRVLGVAPLRAVGLISYGLYVYHWPVFLTLDASRTGLGRSPLFAVRILVTLALAVVSYVLVEQPIRRNRLGRRVVRVPDLRVLAPVAVVAVVCATLVVTWDPPPSTVAYANANPDDFVPRVVEVAPTEGRTPATGASDPTRAPASIMIVGDSSMSDLQPALGAAYVATGTARVVYAAVPGFGLTRDDTEWRNRWAQLVRANHPDIVFVMLGGWDITWMRDHGADAYAAVVDEAIGVLSSGGAKVAWLAMLPGGATPDRPVDAIYEAAEARHAGVVRYIDTERALRTAAGPVYERVLVDGGTRLLLRKPDVWHLCPAGAIRVATSVMQEVAQAAWAAPQVAGWEQGAWRDEEAYRDPVGGCDPRSVGADQ
jgi:peptidoglycan/LPS O-acetylase OafA/YrhL